MSPKLRKNSDRSSRRSMPVARFITENSIPVPRPKTLSPRKPGAVKNCSERESTNAASFFGASMKSSALRVGACPGRAGRSPVGAARGAFPWPCTPATRPPRSTAPDRSGWRAPRRGFARRVPLDQVVEGALGVEHHRPQLAVHVRLHAALLIAQLGQAERSGQPLGRVDREHRNLLPARGHPQRDGRRGSRLADPARARADADALPLEPVLDHMLPNSPRQLVELRAAERRREQERQGAHARPRLLETAELLLCPRPPVLEERGLERGAGPGPAATVRARARRSRRPRSAGHHAVDDDRVERHVVRGEPVLELERLGHRHLPAAPRR